jgi:hypothetical protein
MEIAARHRLVRTCAMDETGLLESSYLQLNIAKKNNVSPCECIRDNLELL